MAAPKTKTSLHSPAHFKNKQQNDVISLPNVVATLRSRCPARMTINHASISSSFLASISFFKNKKKSLFYLQHLNWKPHPLAVPNYWRQQPANCQLVFLNFLAPARDVHNTDRRPKKERKYKWDIKNTRLFPSSLLTTDSRTTLNDGPKVRRKKKTLMDRLVCWFESMIKPLVISDAGGNLFQGIPICEVISEDLSRDLKKKEAVELLSTGFLFLFQMENDLDEKKDDDFLPRLFRGSIPNLFFSPRLKIYTTSSPPSLFSNPCCLVWTCIREKKVSLVFRNGTTFWLSLD